MNGITFTGADARTNVDDLVALIEHPAVEIGILYTATPEGRNRYPSLEQITDFAFALQGRCAIHICGMRARNALISGELASLVRAAGRIQVNGVLTPDQLRLVAGMVPQVITQHTRLNEQLARMRVVNHSVLVDDSGGKGLSPLFWEAPDVVEGKRVGFAGGLGHDNLSAELPKIAAAAGEAGATTWLDMEGRLRTGEDWFDVNQALRCLDIFDKFIAREVISL